MLLGSLYQVSDQGWGILLVHNCSCFMSWEAFLLIYISVREVLGRRLCSGSTVWDISWWYIALLENNVLQDIFLYVSDLLMIRSNNDIWQGLNIGTKVIVVLNVI